MYAFRKCNSNQPSLIPHPHQMILCAFNTTTATTTPATNAIIHSQKHQQIQVRWRRFRCWPSSHESLGCGLAVMVVQVLKAERGRPESERAEGERKPGMEGRRREEGKEGRRGGKEGCGFSSACCCSSSSFGEREKEVRVVRRKSGRVLALEADFFSLDGRRTVGAIFLVARSASSLSLSAAFSASISACQISSRLSVASAGVDADADKMLMEVMGDAGKAGDK